MQFKDVGGSRRLLIWHVKGMVYNPFMLTDLTEANIRRLHASTQYSLRAEILQQAEADDHLTIFYGVGNFKRQRMACQNARGQRAAPCR